MRNLTRVFLILLGLAAPSIAQLLPDVFYPHGRIARGWMVRLTDLNRDGKYDPNKEYFIYHQGTMMSWPESVRFYKNGTVMLWTNGDRNTSANTGAYIAELKVKSGRLNASEAKRIAAILSPDDAVLDSRDRIWVTNDFGSPGEGLWRFEDKNKDGDWNDPGEQLLMIDNQMKLVVQGASGPVTLSTGNDFEGLALDAGDWILAFEQRDHVIYRIKDLNDDGDVQDTGEVVNFLNYANVVKGLANNPDMTSGKIPGLSWTTGPNAGQPFTHANLELIVIDGSNAQQPVYYFAPYWGPSTVSHGGNRVGYVWQGIDKNRNGHLNDPGEVTNFYDGSTGIPGIMGIGEGADFYAGGFYWLDNDMNAPTHTERLIELIDVNRDGDALDNGEQRVVFVDSTDPLAETLAFVLPGFMPRPNSVRGQTVLNGTPKGGNKINFSLVDLDQADNGGFGIVALSLLGDGRVLGGIPLGDGPNRFVPLDVDPLAILTLTTLSPIFTTQTIASQQGTTKDFALPPGLPPKLTFFASGVVVTGRGFGSITDSIRIVTE